MKQTDKKRYVSMLLGGAIGIASLLAPLAPAASVAASPVPASSSTWKSTAMNEKTAVRLVTEAVQRLRHVQQGGALQGKISTFMYKGKEYRYLGKDIDTKKEYLAYLQKTFTPSVSEALYKQAGLIVYKGRLAQVNADGGDMRQWGNAQATFVKGAKWNKEYELKIPMGDKTNPSFATVRVKLLYLKGIGWRVATVIK